MLHKVTIAGLTMDPTSNTPIVILKTEQGDHTVPIWIGLLEATAIASALKNISFERPMTHDLFRNFLQRLQMRVTHIEVCDLRDNTYFAKVHFASEQEAFFLDARPSDALALALRFEAPIFLDDQVIAKAGQPVEAAEAADGSEEGQKWAEYLEKLDPDEFGKYKM
jgi:hypothetical protein